MTKAAALKVATLSPWLLGCVLLSFPSSALAIAEHIQAMGALVLNIGIAVVVVLLIGLVIAIAMAKRTIRQREEAMQSLQAKYALQQEEVDRFNCGVLYLDAHGNILYANRLSAYYLVKTIDQMTSASVTSVFPKEQQAVIDALLSQTSNGEFQCLLGKRPRPVRIKYSPLQKPVGDVHAYIALEDVEHYQHEIDTREREYAHLTGTLSHASLAMASVDLDNNTLTPNPALALMLGWSADSPISIESFTGLIADSSQHDWQRALKDMREGTSVSVQLNAVSKEKPIAIEIHATPFISEDTEAVNRATVVVENHQVLEQLKANAEHYQKILSSTMSASPMPIYVLDAEQRLIDCNRPFCSLFKVELNRIKGKPIQSIELLHEAFREVHARTETIGTRRKELSLEIDEQPVDINLYLLAFKSKNSLAGSVGIIEDITTVNALQIYAEAQAARLKHLIDQSPLGMALFNEEDQIVHINPQLSDLLDKDQAALQGQSFHHLFRNPEHSGTVARLLHQNGYIENFVADLAQGNMGAYSTRIDVSSLPGNPIEYLCWVVDSREEHFLGHQLERLITYSNMPIAIMGMNGFEMLNPAACAFFDDAEDALLGLTPASEALNESKESCEEMAGHLAQLQADKQVNSLPWVHHLKGHTLPCELTLVPLFDQNQQVATLCMWVDLRAIEEANAARLEAVNLRQLAEREVAEKQQLLENSQDLLASRARSLQDTQEKLQAAEDDLATKLDTITNLQQAHEDISEHLNSLQEDYDRNRTLLEQSQEANAELEAQLEESSDKVNRLQKQRNQIADALQYSERKCRTAQEQLEASERNAQRLKDEQVQQQATLDASLAQINSLKDSINDKDRQIHDVSGKINTLQSQLVSSSQTSEKLREQLINQRKASEVAERKRRELELMCQQAQAELSNKSSYVDHLQHEMQMLEEMSQQQKGDMEKQTQQLEQELQAKQAALDSTAQALNDARAQSEQEKQQRAERESQLAQLQDELQEVEKRSEAQQQQIAERDKEWQHKQAELHAELLAKQEALKQTTEELNNTQQQTEEQKAAQAERLERLQTELHDVEKRAAEQDAKIAQSDQQWQQQQQALAEELAAKKAQLEQSQAQLNEHQRQVDEEKLARKAQEDKLEQLKQEMANVESRAQKQREMMQGSDEQWRQHHEEIEKQKQQLQQALEQAQAQNQQMKSTLESKLEALKSAESTVSKTQSDEQKLQEELNSAKAQADALQERLNQQEQQELKLKQQVTAQQESLQQREDNIASLQQEQKRLTEALQSVKEEYAQSKASLSDQNTSQQQLTEQLKALESELHQSQQQLSEKESALEDAQQQIASSAEKLAAQEQALIDTQKEEIKQHSEQAGEHAARPIPEFASLPMPAEPEVWFDLLPYLQNKQGGVTSLAQTLNSLIDELQANMDALDKAVEDDNHRDIQLMSRKLIGVLETVHSEPLRDMANRLQMFCENRLVDNIAIFWPTAKQNLRSTLRVIYSHLHAQD